MQPVGIGVIGCGNISSAYLTAAKKFPILNLIALSDANPATAGARGAEFGIPARSVEALLADPAIEIILNLTVPKAHVDVGLKAIRAGKHVHSEKPLGIEVAEARRLVEAAAAKGLRLGCAPDTFLGGAHQTARRALDEGLIGRPISGAAFFMCPGHERWHPNPGFYYLAGGGPMLDMGLTMSPTWSIFLGRWRASVASRPERGPSASSRASRSRAHAFPSRSPHTSPGL
jgi:predicted dehydrogenase